MLEQKQQTTLYTKYLHVITCSILLTVSYSISTVSCSISTVYYSIIQYLTILKIVCSWGSADSSCAAVFPRVSAEARCRDSPGWICSGPHRGDRPVRFGCSRAGADDTTCLGLAVRTTDQARGGARGVNGVACMAVPWSVWVLWRASRVFSSVIIWCIHRGSSLNKRSMANLLHLPPMHLGDPNQQNRRAQIAKSGLNIERPHQTRPKTESPFRGGLPTISSWPRQPKTTSWTHRSPRLAEQEASQSAQAKLGARRG